MTGPLHRLIARHREEPSIRPRASSRFEPAVAPPVSWDPPGDVRREPATSPRPLPAALAQIPAPPSPPVPGVKHALRQPGPGPAPVPQETGATREPDPFSTHPPVPDRPREVRPGIESVVAALVDAGARIPDRSDRAFRQERDPPRPDLIQPRPDLSQPTAVARDARARAMSPLVTPPVGNGALSAGSPRGALTQPTAREPDVVHVHIGRVEVRAVMPGPERGRDAPAPRAARGPLSLDDYLAGKGRA
jgi:hypothetical protein